MVPSGSSILAACGGATSCSVDRDGQAIASRRGFYQDPLLAALCRFALNRSAFYRSALDGSALDRCCLMDAHEQDLPSLSSALRCDLDTIALTSGSNGQSGIAIERGNRCDDIA